MRMGPDRTIDIRKTVRDRQKAIEFPHAGRDRDDAADARGLGARDDRVKIWREVREIQMTRAVDKHLA